jgi:hypothetical protein
MLSVNYAQCRKKPIVDMLNVVMLSVVMLNVVAPNLTEYLEFKPKTEKQR